MAHHCQEHWASQHTWQTVPSVAEGQRSAGSGIGSEQAEQEGMLGSGIGPPAVPVNRVPCSVAGVGGTAVGRAPALAASDLFRSFDKGKLGG